MQPAAPLSDLINSSTLRRVGHSALPGAPVRSGNRRRPARRAYESVVRRTRLGRRAA